MRCLEEYEDSFINEIYYAYEIIQNRDILFRGIYIRDIHM